MTDFPDLARSQRAHRAFADGPVDDVVIERVITAATRAPSAENAQPWAFVVIREPAARKAIGALMARAWDGGARRFEQGRIPDTLLADVEAGAHGGIMGAPVLVLVAADTQAVPRPALASSIWPAVQNLLLAATAEGLGSALTTLATTYTDEVRSLTGLPQHFTPVAVVPVGHPARPLRPGRRRPITDVAHRERFGVPW